MRRVLVIGCGGAGKSTLARDVASRTRLPLIHLDQLYWKPGWVGTAEDEWERVVDGLIARDRWVMDGNYGGTLPQRLAASDTVLFLDLPTIVCLWRAVKRVVQHRGRSRPDMPAGCPEHVSIEFLWWILTYRRTRRPGILRRLAALPPSTPVEVLKSRKDVRRFVAGLAR